MSNYVHSQLETSHYNDAGVSFYAYFRKEPSEQDWEEATSSPTAEPLALTDPVEWEDREEVPSALSVGAGLRRYCLGGAG